MLRQLVLPIEHIADYLVLVKYCLPRLFNLLGR
jgi:hypothetical protein